MSEREILLSAEGKKNLEDELNELKHVRRKEVAARIKAAREFGDLSENSEWEDAKNEQAFVEGRVQTLEKILRHARVAENGSEAPDVISVGTTVTVDKEDPKGHRSEERYTIVGSHEADPQRGKISNESPIGRALMGQKQGSEVQVTVPAGIFKFKVRSIEV